MKSQWNFENPLPFTRKDVEDADSDSEETLTAKKGLRGMLDKELAYCIKHKKMLRGPTENGTFKYFVQQKAAKKERARQEAIRFKARREEQRKSFELDPYEVMTVADIIYAQKREIPSTFACIRKADELRDKLTNLTSNSAYDMKIYEIATYLSCRVVYQDSSTFEVAKLLKGAINTSFTEDDNNVPTIMLLSGASGAGKTQTVKEVKKLLKMCKRQIHKDAYIEYRLASMNGEAQLSIVTGAAPGYTGWGETEPLYDKLVNACKHYDTFEQETRHDMLLPHLVFAVL